MISHERAALAVAAVTLVVLLWAMDPAAVGRMVVGVGWGMGLILSQELVAHLLNALGWRLAFTADQAAAFPLLELVRLRIAGDAVNYLTPSANIAGEVTRTVLLNDSHRVEVRAAAVLVAKCVQTLAQILFAATGVLLVFGGHVPFPAVLAGGAIVAALAASGLGIRRARQRRGAPASGALPRTGLRAVLAGSRDFVARHPGRLVLSTVMFVLAYAWGAFEAYWICHFIGLPVGVGAALTIEALSTAVDSILFMVPAKVGTQEGGKAAVFVALGLPAASGFAFGVVRHVRELIWAGLGLLLRWTHQPAPASPARPAI